MEQVRGGKNTKLVTIFNFAILVYYIAIVTVKAVAMWMLEIYEKHVGWIDIFSPFELSYVLLLIIFPLFYYLSTFFAKYKSNIFQIMLVNSGPPLLIIYILFF